jgi:cytochrome c-type biogenesis protein CcmH/NrfG
MTRVRGLADALWPAALLLVFLATFRRTVENLPGQPAAAGCDEPRGQTLAMLEQCLASDSRNVEVLTAIGDIDRASGAADRAEAMYRRALAIDPRDGDVHLRLAELLLARGDGERARMEAEGALSSQPGNPAAEELIERASRESDR